MEFIMNSTNKTIISRNIIIICIVLLSLINITYTFAVTKKNYFTDEIWSYGLSNSYYDPFIFANGDVSTSRKPENYKNINSWITSDVFFDYIAVNEGEAFSYDSVWYNQSLDVHPPLYYALLHTICSFFPNVFSNWFGFSINIIAFLLVAFFLYKICYSVTSSHSFSLMLLAFYSFNAAAVDTYIFIRMYALVTVFYVALLYYVQKLLSSTAFSFLKHCLPLLCITYLGTLTHYHFAIFAFLISAGTCFYLLFTKKIAKLFAFASTMLSGIILSFLSFPSIIDHITKTNASALETSFSFNFSYILTLLFGYQTGMLLNPYKSMFGSYFFVVVTIVLFVTIPIWFVFRNEAWMKSLLKNLIKISQKALKNTKTFLLSLPPILYIAMMSIIGILVFLAQTLAIPKTYRTTSRYLFPTIAIYYFVFFAILYYAAKAFHLSVKHCKITFVSLIVICSLTSNLIFHTTFDFSYSPYSGKTMDKLEDNSTCIIAVNSAWLLTAFPSRLLQVENICVVDLEYLFDSPNELDHLPSSSEESPVYLLLDCSSMIPEGTEYLNIEYTPEHTKEDYLDYFSKLPYVEQFNLVGEDCAHSSNLEIYQLR